LGEEEKHCFVFKKEGGKKLREKVEKRGSKPQRLVLRIEQLGVSWQKGGGGG